MMSLDELDMWSEEWNVSSFSNITEGNNLTLTCAARNIQGPIDLPNSSALTTTVRVLQSLSKLLIILAGIVLNTLVIVLVAKYKKLQTLSFLVSLQVVALDLVLAIAILPSLVTTLANQWLLGEYMCAINGFILNTTATARTLLMCVFVIDRYLAVVWPYFYPKHKFKVTVSLSIASWVFAVLVSIGMMPGILDCYSLRSTGKVCAPSSRCNLNCSVYIRSLATYVVPATIVPIILYGLLYYKGRKIQKELASNAAANANHRREWKATITFSLLFFSLFVLILPNTIIEVVVRTAYAGRMFPAAAHVLLTVNSSVLSLLVITDPIVIMRDKDVKEVLIKLRDFVFCKKFRMPTVKADNQRATALWSEITRTVAKVCNILKLKTHAINHLMSTMFTLFVAVDVGKLE